MINFWTMRLKTNTFYLGYSQPGVKLLKLFSGRMLLLCLKTVTQFYFMEGEGASYHAEL